ncbi:MULTISPECIES: TetR family transcriptional regulator [Sphingomonadales]|jgi:AcrR family transcriptional regulator|uniref:Transcriptional regulator, TetR family n=1 Tax=Rhizorhabdus wittichii (strain DSM 6014 / CCUG 31198 / JCM 15750 / NBRC 105917 / EY 4224 / RW1) TaxID=392499 RepID=A0A9J9HCJ6_RHIWR|nr:transcriptional regulator, TetR family [Rhizorhabdus wittichii RW1]ARR54107.1 TetR family transcriptional regulator [Rhizorhabdus wittichii DC-6]
MGNTSARGARRLLLTEALADIVLQEGLDALSLRPAAARLGTSDRMLLYYFGTKAALMDDVLGCVSDRFTDYLARSSRGIRIAPHNMVGHTTALMATPEAKPFVELWFEIAARAARGDTVYAAAATRIAETWNDWIVSTVRFPAGVSSRNAAAMMLAIVNGIALLDSTAPSVAAAARSRVQTVAA